MYRRDSSCVFFFTQKTANEGRISNWRSDVCSSDLASSRARGNGEIVELGERDLSFNVVVGTILGSLIPIAGLLWFFAQGGPIGENPVAVIFATLLFVLFIGAIIAAVTGYMAGLIGASNSPVSGVGIPAVIAASLMLLPFFGRSSE